jgi:hypothetical protein
LRIARGKCGNNRAPSGANQIALFAKTNVCHIKINNTERITKRGSVYTDLEQIYQSKTSLFRGGTTALSKRGRAKTEWHMALCKTCRPKYFVMPCINSVWLEKNYLGLGISHAERKQQIGIQTEQCKRN